MARGLFVTGTDTGVGKTVVTCAIAAALCARGLRVGVYKPVETGVAERDGVRAGEDCERLCRAAGSVQQPSEIASYLLLEPAAPLPAAEAEGAVVDPTRLRADFARVAARFDVVLVESAGGLMVPITETYLYRDLARDLGLPLLCVIASRLGCLNHALLTLDAAGAAGIGVAGYVWNHIHAHDEYALASRTNADVLRRASSAACLGSLPNLGAGGADLAEVAERHLRLDAIVHTVR